MTSYDSQLGGKKEAYSANRFLDISRADQSNKETDTRHICTGTSFCFEGLDRVSVIVLVPGPLKTQAVRTDIRLIIRPIGEMPIDGCYTDTHLGRRSLAFPLFTMCPVPIRPPTVPLQETAPHNELLQKGLAEHCDGLEIRRNTPSRVR